jgi:hypothetical protein
LVDYKSRGWVGPLPRDFSHTNAGIQISIYKDLVDRLIASFPFEEHIGDGAQTVSPICWLCQELMYDPLEEFSPRYLAQLQGLKEPSPRTAGTELPKGLTTASSTKDLVEVLRDLIRKLGLGDPLMGGGRCHPYLYIIYIHRDDFLETVDHSAAKPIKIKAAMPGKTMVQHQRQAIDDAQFVSQAFEQGLEVYEKLDQCRLPPDNPRMTYIHKEIFTYNWLNLRTRIKAALDFWHGRREMQGPVGRDELEGKCKNCPFVKHCPYL